MREHDASTSLFLCEFEDDAFCVSWSDGRWITIFENGKVLVGRSPQSPEHPTQVTSYAELTTPAIPERGGWRDIASAPKDGTRVLLWLEPAAIAMPFQWGSGKWLGDDFPLNMAIATHWQPLPAAPGAPAPAGELEEMRAKIDAFLNWGVLLPPGNVGDADALGWWVDGQTYLIENAKVHFARTHPGATTKGVS